MSQNVFFKHIILHFKLGNDIIKSQSELGIFNVTYLVAKNNSLPTSKTKVCSTHKFKGKNHGFESFYYC